ncbi:MAG: alternative ribosome rescue aminoacyl-tRNA hydrolase ArfB [Fimbriiglobus sp.]
MLEITNDLQIPESDWTWSYARAGGPGGQNVNKVASKAILRLALEQNTTLPDAVKARLRAQFPSYTTLEGDFLISSQKYRDQERNREDCLAKLTAMIRKAAKPPTIRKKTKPSLGAKRRRLEDKKRNSDVKQSRKSPGSE